MISGLEENGFARVEAVLTRADCDELVSKLPPVPPGTAGSRDLHRLDWMQEYATSGVLASLAGAALGENASVVRVLYFDKQPGSNWKLPYHQDLTICVRDRRDMAGFGPWSVKDGHDHVQPERAILEGMVAIRLHLDDCGRSNGALRVLPGTHKLGKLSAAEVDSEVEAGEEVFAQASRGDAILMRPLLLHASSPAQTPDHRRVLHIEYSAGELPSPLEWLLGWPLQNETLPA